MLIDDDDVTLMICKLRLKKSGFCNNVITADNGEEAVKLLEDQFKLPLTERNLPELIFLDLNMPIMDGWQFLEAFENRYLDEMPGSKITILSSSVDPIDEEKASKYSFVTGFINKPLTDLNLKAMMEMDEFKQYFS